MKKYIVFLAAFLFVGCASIKNMYAEYRKTPEQKRQEKIEEYKKNAPAGYNIQVSETEPYDLISFYFKIIQVLDKDSVLACYAISSAYSYETYKLGQCRDEEILHIKFPCEHEELYDDHHFEMTYFKNEDPFFYTNTLGATKKIRSISTCKAKIK